MSPLPHADGRAEALPRPPVVERALEHGHVVDPDLHRPGDGHDEVAIPGPARREERLRVEHAVLDPLARRGQATRLLDAKGVRYRAAQRIGGPRGRPGARLLRVEGAPAVDPRAVPERTGELDAAAATGALLHGRVVGVPGRFRLVERFGE